LKQATPKTRHYQMTAQYSLSPLKFAMKTLNTCLKTRRPRVKPKTPPASFGKSASGWLPFVLWVALLLTPLRANSALLWHDGFELGPGQYTAGASLAGQSGGTGTFFTGPWIQPLTDDTLVFSNSLSIMENI
jgi:hypothetical protein